MDGKGYPAFGYVLVRTKLKAGEVVNDEMMTNNVFTVEDPQPGANGNISGLGAGYVWFLCSGVHSYRDLATGVKDIHETGWCNLVKPMHAGSFEFASETDSEYVCFSPVLNAARKPVLPEIEFVEMEAGQQRLFPVGTKLYILDGELSINGKTFPSMRQVHVKSGDVSALANKKTWGYIFKV
jgi:hypothetical protein